MGARYYNATEGRFISPDPFGHAASMDLYSFANGDPVNFVDPTGRADRITVGIGGTGSERSFKRFADGTSTISVMNMIESIDGETRFFHGPGSFLDTRDVHNDVYGYISEQVRINPNVEINILAHSRGGHVGVEVPRSLGTDGVALENGTTIYPEVNFLGLYDAVDMTPFYGAWSQDIPSNVNNAAHAMSDPSVGSRPYFNTVDGGVQDASATNYIEQLFDVTHGGIGGSPWGGDHPRGMTQERDIAGAQVAYDWIVQQASNAGLDINPTGRTSSSSNPNASSVGDPTGKHVKP